MPEKDIARLQGVQNCLARVVTKAPRFSRSVPILKRLHWLPVKFRIHFKICTITFRTLRDNQPAYLAYLGYLFGRYAQNIYAPQIYYVYDSFAVPRIKKTRLGQELSLYLAQPYGKPCLYPYVMPKQF